MLSRRTTDSSDSLTVADDDDHVLLTDKPFGACRVKVVRALKEADKLNVGTFANLETVLKLAANRGDVMSDAMYQEVLRGIGQRLFKDKSPEVIAREKVMTEEWIAHLDEESQKVVRQDMEDEEEDEDPDAGPWFDEKEANEDLDHASFKWTTVWKGYTAYMKTVPSFYRGADRPRGILTSGRQRKRCRSSFDGIGLKI